MVDSVFTPEELVDAVIVDSEGYVYAFVEKAVVEPERLVLSAYVKKSSTKEQIDIERLEQDLTDTVKKRFGKPTSEDLYREIQKETGQSEIADQTIIDFAKRRGVAIPTRQVTETLKKPKGKIPWSMVQRVNKTDQGVCIILNKPIEAEERKITVAEAVPYKELSEIKDKTVIDDEAKILGQVSGIKISHDGEPQLTLLKRIVEKKEETDYDKLEENVLYTRGWTKHELDENVKRELGLYALPTPDELLRWAATQGIPIPRRTVSTSRLVHFKFLVPWRCIKKLGDVILLNKCVEDLV